MQRVLGKVRHKKMMAVTACQSHKANSEWEKNELKALRIRNVGQALQLFYLMAIFSSHFEGCCPRCVCAALERGARSVD